MLWADLCGLSSLARGTEDRLTAREIAWTTRNAAHPELRCMPHTRHRPPIQRGRSSPNISRTLARAQSFEVDLRQDQVRLSPISSTLATRDLIDQRLRRSFSAIRPEPFGPLAFSSAAGEAGGTGVPG